jgi:hypothetical protein
MRTGSCYFLQDVNKKGFLLLTYEGTFTYHFLKIKSHKEVTKSGNQGFSNYIFCLMIEGSGAGSISVTNGSGPEKPKNLWILWIRIRNTASHSKWNKTLKGGYIYTC